jgi:hypothetical protein
MEQSHPPSQPAAPPPVDRGVSCAVGCPRRRAQRRRVASRQLTSRTRSSSTAERWQAAGTRTAGRGARQARRPMLLAPSYDRPTPQGRHSPQRAQVRQPVIDRRACGCRGSATALDRTLSRRLLARWPRRRASPARDGHHRYHAVSCRGPSGDNGAGARESEEDTTQEAPPNRGPAPARVRSCRKRYRLEMPCDP